jgi:hypothetical protein
MKPGLRRVMNRIFGTPRGDYKCLAFSNSSTTKEFFLDGLKLEQQSHKCVELRGEYVE